MTHYQIETEAMHSAVRSRARREISEARRRRLRRLRRVLTLPFLIGLAVASYLVVNGDSSGTLVILALALTLPLIATWDLLGEAPR